VPLLVTGRLRKAHASKKKLSQFVIPSSVTVFLTLGFSKRRIFEARNGGGIGGTWLAHRFGQSKGSGNMKQAHAPP
jgi:hypothetical protein